MKRLFRMKPPKERHDAAWWSLRHRQQEALILHPDVSSWQPLPEQQHEVVGTVHCEPHFDGDGNRLWWASSEGDDLCPVCHHAPDQHVSIEGCQYALPDSYTHMTDVVLCGCPLSPASGSDPSQAVPDA